MRGTALIKACLNGNREPGSHPALPITPPDLAREARRAVEAGAGALHIHPRGPDGLETLEPAWVADALVAARTAIPVGIPVGVTTAAWIEPDPERRVDLVRRWTLRPDFASVNLSEPGAGSLADALLEDGIGVEAGVVVLDDVERLAVAGFADRCVRVLVEVEAEDGGASVSLATEIDAALDRLGVRVPRLHHGYGPPTWAVVHHALSIGRDVRVGLEDVFTLPDGSTAAHNGELVAAAVEMAARLGLVPQRGGRSPGPAY